VRGRFSETARDTRGCGAHQLRGERVVKDLAAVDAGKQLVSLGPAGGLDLFDVGDLKLG
jgi:hypothetical protein